MPAIISDILRTKPELITITPDRPLYEALELMIRYDYSQLPVLDSEQLVVGMITTDSILRALHHFGIVVREPKDDAKRAEHPRVQDVMQRDVQVCGPETEVFTVHRQLRDASGVLVVNDKIQLIGIITGYDTTEYLRQRVQDIVFVQDIEEMIKDYVRLAFRKADGSEDTEARQAAIAELMPSNSDLSGAFKRGIAEYINLCGDKSVKMNAPAADEAFRTKLYYKTPPKDFDELVLNEYITLFFKYGLSRYGHVFPLDRAAMKTLLDSVRETRNDLAHLRIDISARQRDELRLCREWLKHYYEDARDYVLPREAEADSKPSPLIVSPEVPLVEHTSSDESKPLDASNEDELLLPVEEQRSPGESRYAALADWLFKLATDQDRISLSFGQIEQIIDGTLPPSAREYRSWWANDPSKHTQAEQWLSAGWRTDDVDLKRNKVTFSRIQPRERAYIDFFEALFRELRASGALPTSQPTRVGYSWQTVAKVPDQQPFAGYTTFSFTRIRRPRAEFYIDTGDAVRNKAIFDALYLQRSQIETAFGSALEWERLPEKRASRIAIYYDSLIDINASPDELRTLRTWGVEMLIRFKQTFDGPVQEVLAQPSL